MSHQKGQALQDPFLNALRKERIPVSIFLVNGIKLQGQIESFDQFVVLLKNSVNQMIYKHAISTVVPGRPVKLSFDEEDHFSFQLVDEEGVTHTIPFHRIKQLFKNGQCIWQRDV